jgi:hypothetical protein
MLYNPNDKDHKLAGDRAMEVFLPVFVVENDHSKTIVRYNVVVSTVVEFKYVVSLLAAGLTFNHISRVVDSNRDILGTVGKQRSMSPGEVSCTARIVCDVALQLLSDLMWNSLSFSIGAHASTYRFGHAHLDARIRLPPIQTWKPLLSLQEGKYFTHPTSFPLG